MRNFWLGFGGFVFACVPALLAQSVALPDAPALPAHQGLNLSLPAAKYEAPVPAEKKPLVCGAPESGVYTVENMMSPAALAGVMQNYQNNAGSQIYQEWIRSYKRIHGNSWMGGIVTLRVAVRPDGTALEPEVAVSSGHPGEDAGAQQAVRDVVSFPPLPDGRKRPFVMCMSFGYNRYQDDMEDRPKNERWLDPKATGATVPKAKGQP